MKRLERLQKLSQTFFCSKHYEPEADMLFLVVFLLNTLATTTKLVSFYFCHKKLTLEKCGDKRAFIYACIVLKSISYDRSRNSPVLLLWLVNFECNK
jgi:hypothetical protein